PPAGSAAGSSGSASSKAVSAFARDRSEVSPRRPRLPTRTSTRSWRPAKGRVSPGAWRACGPWGSSRAERAREVADPLEGAGLFEQVGRAGNDLERALAPQTGRRLAVQLQHDRVVASDDQQRRRAQPLEGATGEVRPPAPGDDRRDDLAQLRRGHERR